MTQIQKTQNEKIIPEAFLVPLVGDERKWNKLITNMFGGPHTVFFVLLRFIT